MGDLGKGLLKTSGNMTFSLQRIPQPRGLAAGRCLGGAALGTIGDAAQHADRDMVQLLVLAAALGL
jgi:hypothetical protein